MARPPAKVRDDGDFRRPVGGLPRIPPIAGDRANQKKSPPRTNLFPYGMDFCLRIWIRGAGHTP
jgi:hypothetical protein